jgi:hypothetical protein
MGILQVVSQPRPQPLAVSSVHRPHLQQPQPTINAGMAGLTAGDVNVGGWGAHNVDGYHFPAWNGRGTAPQRMALPMQQPQFPTFNKLPLYLKGQ